jgi:hypothetical protein
VLLVVTAGAPFRWTPPAGAGGRPEYTEPDAVFDKSNTDGKLEAADVSYVEQ